MNTYMLATFLHLGAAIHDAASKNKGAILELDKDVVKDIDKVILEICGHLDTETMLKAILIVERRINDN